MKKLFTLLLTIITITSVNAQTYGCTDPTAANYIPLANIDDGSCDYNCYLPDSIWVSDITESSFTVAFTSIVNATMYRFFYRELGTTSWTVLYSTSNTFSALNLNIATTYEYKFKTVCGSIVSSFSPIYQITTNEIYGCMDDRAINYNSLVTADDGSCNFTCFKRHWAKNISSHQAEWLPTKVWPYKKGAIALLQRTLATTQLLDTSITFNPLNKLGFSLGSISPNGDLDWVLSPNNITYPDPGYDVNIGSSSLEANNNINQGISINSNNEIAIAITTGVNGFSLGNYSITTPTQNATENYAILAKIDSLGNPVFVTHFDNDVMGLISLKIKDNGHIYLVGTSDQPLLNANNPTFNNSWSYFIYLQNYNPIGNVDFTRWIQCYDSSGNEAEWLETRKYGMVMTEDYIFFHVHVKEPFIANGDSVLKFVNYAGTYQPIDTAIIYSNYNFSQGWREWNGVIKMSLTGDLIGAYEESDFEHYPTEVFNDKILSYTINQAVRNSSVGLPGNGWTYINNDTIFELDTHLNSIASHVYPGLSNIQTYEDVIILTIGNQMLIVNENFNTIDTIDVVGLYNDGAVYICNATEQVYSPNNTTYPNPNAGGLLGDTVIFFKEIKLIYFQILKKE